MLDWNIDILILNMNKVYVDGEEWVMWFGKVSCSDGKVWFCNVGVCSESVLFYCSC